MTRSSTSPSSVGRRGASAGGAERSTTSAAASAPASNTSAVAGFARSVGGEAGRTGAVFSPPPQFRRADVLALFEGLATGDDAGLERLELEITEGSFLQDSGVETEQHAEFLKGAGGALGQGYSFSRPLPAEPFASRALPPPPAGPARRASDAEQE